MTDKSKAVERSAQASGALAVEKLDAHSPTRADRLRVLEQQYQGKSSRFVLAGIVYMCLDMDSGDRIAGRGKTTEDALTHLERRLTVLGKEA